MTVENRVIRLSGRVGLLACAPDLLQFYNCCHWRLFVMGQLSYSAKCVRSYLKTRLV